MHNLINQFNRFENLLLILWGATIIASGSAWIDAEFPVLFCSTVFAILYLIQGQLAVVDAHETKMVRGFPRFFGVSSALLVIGITAQTLDWNLYFATYLGIVMMLIACLMLFRNKFQDVFLPVLKKLPLRAAVLIALAMYAAF